MSQTIEKTFKYDSLYRLTEAKEEVSRQSNSSWKQNFTYDSAGNLAETVIFVYSGGKLVEEYSTVPPTSSSTKYVATDTLQSVRAISDQNGEVISRRDFLPFGEELPSDTNLRKTDYKYASTDDGVRQKFTGYEKDEETGLDFAQARMYNNQHARFTAVDPLLASGKSGNPQTFNRYVYVMNSPLIFTDPSGLQVAQRFCNNCQPAIRGTGKNETLGVFEKGAKLPKGFKPITERREFHGESNRSYWLTATTVLPYDPKTKAKQIVDDGVKFINSGHGLPSESSERQNLIKDRIICMVGSSGCSQTFKDAGIPTTEEVILQRGITIADPLILKSPESVNLIGDGFTEEARQSGVEYLNDGGWIFRGSDAFSLVPDDYESNPSQRAFTFFKEQAFKLDGWFGGGQPTRLNEAVPHEMTHDSNVPVYPRPPLTFFYNDLTGYPYYENILKNCMCPEENN